MARPIFFKPLTTKFACIEIIWWISLPVCGDMLPWVRGRTILCGELASELSSHSSYINFNAITGNGWAAAGMLRVLETMRHSESSVDFTGQQTNLTMWIQEILDGTWVHQVNARTRTTIEADFSISKPMELFSMLWTTLLLLLILLRQRFLLLSHIVWQFSQVTLHTSLQQTLLPRL
jgi:hypothetical protein